MELQREKAEDRKYIERLKLTHERHVAVKNKERELSTLVEKNLLQANTEAENALAALRAENERLQRELARYTHTSNPLPRPPELNPAVSNILRQSADITYFTQGAATSASVATGVVVPAPPQDVIGVTQPTSITSTEPPAPQQARSKYKITSNGEQLRQENRRRPHLIVPGAPPFAKVLPEDMDATPRAANTGPVRPLGMWAGDDWTADYTDPRPRPGEPVVWAGLPQLAPPGIPNLTVGKPIASTADGGAFPPPFASAPGVAAPPGFVAQPSNTADVGPVMNLQFPTNAAEVQMPGEPYLPRSARMPVDPPEGVVTSRSPNRHRPGRAHRPGYMMAFYPGEGIRWVTEKQASKMPIRARGTESRHPYVIAKEPDEIDVEWRQRNGNAPCSGLNPLQLSGVPENVVAGPSTSSIEREEEIAVYATAREESNLLRGQPEATNRSAMGLSISNHPGPSRVANSARPEASALLGSSHRNANGASGLGISPHAEPGRSTTARPLLQNHVVDEMLPQPSPASSWETSNYQPSRRSSLSLNVNNLPALPPPNGSQQYSESLEQIPLSVFAGGPITLIADGASISIRTDSSSRNRETSGVQQTSREGSSRQVVSGLQDLDDIDRSLQQVAERTSQRDAHSTRPSGSSRHSRNTSFSEHESEAIIGPRTGLALYGSRPATQYSSSRASVDPSPVDPSQVAVRSPSRSSIRSRADSTYSHRSRASSSSQRSVEQRARRSSNASGAPLRDPLDIPLSSWAAEPADIQPYASRGPYASNDSRPQASRESIPRSLGPLDGIGGTSGSLMLSFEAPSTSSAVDRNGEAAAGIHAPRPLSSRQPSLFNGWNARHGR
ncbi:hypothetical protein C8Q73DRAFT_687478 [Cubamyces lactineus]|nr:hypothetical protein C8Q73DRAFT_687478 [Cubamyces lactineus]